MEITVFGNVRTRVERIPIASTTPSTFPAIIQSPIANGLSATRETEPKKLAIVSFEANAKAAPPIPKDARTALTLAPHKSNSIKRSIISRDILNNLRPKSIIFIAAEGRLKNLAVKMSNIKSPIIAIIQNINKFVNGFRHPHKESFSAEEKNDTNPSRYDTIYKRIFPVLTD